jgi:23S rRNA-/tRNA-specific pseudouridylate synthase
MKRILIFIALLSMIAISCGTPGNTAIKLHGDEDNLPAELRGLKVYTVDLGTLDYIKVAVLNNKVIGTSYSEGKTTANVGIVDLNNVDKTSIVYEDDDFIIIRKK